MQEKHVFTLNNDDAKELKAALNLIHNFASTCFEGERDTMTEQEEKEYLDAFNDIEDFIDNCLENMHR